MTAVELKQLFGDLRDEIVALSAEKGPNLTMINEVWVHWKYHTALRQLAYYLKCDIKRFEISAGEFTPPLWTERDSNSEDIDSQPCLVECSFLLKKLDQVLTFIESHIPKSPRTIGFQRTPLL